MRRTAPQLLAGVVVVLMLLPIAAAAQMTMRPTPVPIVTAENEYWYLEGEPITFSGSIYYPAGPEIYFIPYEMVRSGEFRGIPLYSRTTIEPFSKVFVPLPGGRMLPYERRRAGDLAGTTGSTAPSGSAATTPGNTAPSGVVATTPKNTEPKNPLGDAKPARTYRRNCR